MIYSKPSYAAGPWAANGNIIQPTSEKVETGWVVEKPKNELMNWLQNKQDTSIACIFQQGITDWDDETEYPTTGYTKFNGTLYQAISQNTAAQPDTSPAIWAKPFAALTDFLDLSDVVNNIRNTDGFLTHYVRIAAPVMTAKCSGTSYTANIGLISIPTDDVGYSFNTKTTSGLFHDGSAVVVQNEGDVVAIFEPPLDPAESSKRVVTMDVLREQLQLYKIGDLYLTTSNQDPAVRLGYGSWQPFAEGRALVGVAQPTTSAPAWTKFARSEFGTYEHVLTEEELASHSHRVMEETLNSSGIGGALDTTSEITGYTNGRAVEKTGGDKGHNNVQPSITVYIYVRVG